MGIVILLVILLIIVILYFRGKNNQKKTEKQNAHMKASAQNISMLIIDKKRMKIKDSGLPQVVIDQTPKRMLNSKFPIVKAKIGPKVMTLIADEDVFDKIPTKKEVKATVSGIYIIDVKIPYSMSVVKDDKYDSIPYSKQNEHNFEDWKLRERTIKNVSSVTKVRVAGTNQTYYMGNGNGGENLSFIPNMNSFYDSNYACPHCGKVMFKTNFPTGAEYLIQTKDGKVKLKRVFTCSECHYFASAAKDLLSDGLIYELKISNNNGYIELLRDMNNKGTTKGRPD